jgi:hypothetical protein
VEVLARFVVDSAGRVEAATIQTMPGPDTVFRRVAAEALRQWTFSPAIAGSARVRAQTHLSVVLRPSDADALTLASSPPPPGAADTLRRTVFYMPRVARDRPRAVASNDAWREAIDAMQPYVDLARRTWPSVRERFRRGLPLGHELYITARLTDGLGRTEQAFVRVERVADGTIHGRVQSDIRAVSGWRRGDRLSLPEGELIDWTVVRPNGSEEGNVVGRFLEGYRPPRPH